jgi:hypothetical protein
MGENVNKRERKCLIFLSWLDSKKPFFHSLSGERVRSRGLQVLLLEPRLLPGFGVMRLTVGIQQPWKRPPAAFSEQGIGGCEDGLKPTVLPLERRSGNVGPRPNMDQ